MAAQREWFEKDYYKILGVDENASQKDINRAYRKLARELHPDSNPGDTSAEDRFKEVSAAYDVLGDESKRAEYDEVRRLGPTGAGGPGGTYEGAGGGPGSFSFDMGDMDDMGGLGDMFGQMFGRRRRGGTGAAGAGPRRGADVRADLTLAFRDAAQGLTTTLHLTSDAPCSTCSGSGARPGTAPKVCSICAGRGVVEDNQGMFAFSSPCRNCQGTGTVIEDPCTTCRGSGIEKRAREVQTRIPAGVADGQTIRLKGRGGPGRNGGPAGDLLVDIHVSSDSVFDRRDLDLLVGVGVPIHQAALGGEVNVPTLGGDPVTVKVRPGTQPGSKQRVRGRGIETPKRTGDLIVTMNVEVPTELNDEQRAALEKLAAASDTTLASEVS